MHRSLILLCVHLTLFRWPVHGEEDPLHQSSETVETQYLTFNMTHYGLDGGNFSSPNFPNNYPQDTILFYQFIASTDYRVVVQIDFFQIRGVSPQCTHDYLDVFVNLTDFSVANDQLLHRFCGRNRPPLLISSTNLLLLGFFTEDTQTERGFNGSFRFVPAQRYREHLVREPCDYTFNSSMSKRGELFSSTYPGTYLPWQFCNYSFVGLPGERVHIRFRDLMLFKTPNTQHCAIDSIRLFDNTLQRSPSGFNQSNPVNHGAPSDRAYGHHITDLCGTYPMPLDVYSTKNSLLLYFITTHYAELNDEEQHQLNEAALPFIWRKGFYAEYEFLSTLTKLDFVLTNQSNQYLSGTECDQTIKSFEQGYGIIQSPNWPNSYQPQTSCTTYLLGVDDRYGLENVELEFDQFDVDCQLAMFVLYNASRIYDYHSHARSPSPPTQPTSMTREKPYNSYYQQQVNFKGNLTFCGHFKPEGRFISRYALLKLSFMPNKRLTSDHLPSLVKGGKFQIRYKFIKSYQQSSMEKYDQSRRTDCSLFYHQAQTSSGKFEPPRSSDHDYFSNSNCTFHFNLLNSDVRLLIRYDYFNIADDDLTRCPADNLTYTYRSSTSSTYSRYPYVYCGYRNYPPPYLTTRSIEQLRVHFRSNNDSDTGLGFDGRYEFVGRTHRLFSSTCSNPFDPVVDINEREHASGNLSSHGYPENTICEWSFRTTAGLRFKLELTVLDMEGSQTKDPPQGCQSSVLRIFSADRIDELCGQQEKTTYIFTTSNWFTLQFISLQRQTKEALQGFQLTWTIVQLATDRRWALLHEEYFDCSQLPPASNETSFWIHRSLVCDGYAHCQPLSDADELLSNCSQTAATHSYLLSFSFLRQHYILIAIVVFLAIVTLGVGLTFVVLIIKRKNRLPKEKAALPSRSDASDEDGTAVKLIKQAITTV